MASFWDALGPGLLQTGISLLGQRRQRKAGEEALREAQGPLYDTQQLLAARTLAQVPSFDAQRELAERELAQNPLFDTQRQLAARTLAQAGSLDPKAAAAERFAAQQALLAPGREAQLQQLMRELQKKGLLGVSSFQPVPGTVSQPGVAMNPLLAALFAAHEGAKSRAAFESLQEGEEQVTQQVARAGTLAGQAQKERASGLELLRAKEEQVTQRVARAGTLAGQAQKARASGLEARTGMPPKASIVDTLLKGGAMILQDPQARTAVWEGLKMLPGLFGLGGQQPEAFVQPFIEPSYNYDFDAWSF